MNTLKKYSLPMAVFIIFETVAEINKITSCNVLRWF